MKMELPISRTERVAYRADLDGMRAVSISLVVGYHALPWLVPGGFVGVDVFFVISGFLITRIILTEAKAGTFSLMKFYSRRIRRIFPALIVVLAVTYMIGWFILLPDGFSRLGENVAAGVAFVSNLFLLRQNGYFASEATENPLLHLWSLGIEEQFYIFWPPILLMIFGSRRRHFWMIAIAAVSFGASLMIFFGYKESSFYSPISRAWELLAGGIIAHRFVDWPEIERQRFARLDNVLAITGILAIIGAAIGLNENSLFPGIFASLPVLGAALIIISPNSFVNRILLSNPPTVFLGRISYPLYLWHWPLLVYLGTIRNGVPNFLEIWVTVILAVVLSWLTFHFVEIPVRRQPNAVLRLAFGLIAVGAVGIVTYAASGFAFRFSPQIRDIAQLPPQSNAGFRDTCFLQAPGAHFGPECIEEGDKPLLFLWGDSTAAALYPGLKKAEGTLRFRLARFAAPACAPILSAGSNARCDEVNDIAFDFLRSSKPDIVLLHAMWNEKIELDKLGETIRRIKSIKPLRIVILGPVPVWKRTLPNSLVNFYRFHHAIADRIPSGVSGPDSDRAMETFSRTAGVEYISAWRALCSSEGCMTSVGPAANEVVTTDIVHLSDAGSNFLVDAIGKSLSPRP
jgi:peptidoglycan/LPS O-acetylase OafA/YrhL